MTHYHQDDYPRGLEVLATIARGREFPGLTWTDHGAAIEWPALLAPSFLSTTEVASLHILRGLMTLEWTGAPADHIAAPLAWFAREVLV